MRRRTNSSTPGPGALAAKEKRRRDRMKDLYSTLATDLHLQPYERMSLLEFVERARMSLIQLKERVEQLKARKNELEVVGHESRSGCGEGGLQVVQVTEMGLKLEANLIMMANNNNNKVGPFQVLSVIEEGGAQVTSSTFSTVGQHIYCTIHAQAIQARVGYDAALIKTRLLEVVKL